MQQALNAQTAVEMGTTTKITMTDKVAATDDSSAIAGDYVADAAAVQQQTTAMNTQLNNMKQSAADVQKQYKLGNTAHYTHLVVMVLFWIQAVAAYFASRAWGCTEPFPWRAMLWDSLHVLLVAVIWGAGVTFLGYVLSMAAAAWLHLPPPVLPL